MVICKEHACEKKCENPRETIPVDVYARGRYLKLPSYRVFLFLLFAHTRFPIINVK